MVRVLLLPCRVRWELAQCVAIGVLQLAPHLQEPDTLLAWPACRRCVVAYRHTSHIHMLCSGVIMGLAMQAGCCGTADRSPQGLPAPSFDAF